jgi:hypothetical protein
VADRTSGRVAKSSSMKRFRTEGDISRAILEAREGDFTYLLGEDAGRRWAFVRDRLEVGFDELMIRLKTMRLVRGSCGSPLASLSRATLSPW